MCLSVLQKNEYSSDLAKIYSVHLTNVIGGVASECRQCALTGTDSDSCVSCAPGHYMVNGSGVCRHCPSNTIIRPEQPIGKEACIPCGPNTYSNKVSINYDYTVYCMYLYTPHIFGFTCSVMAYNRI